MNRQLANRILIGTCIALGAGLVIYGGLRLAHRDQPAPADRGALPEPNPTARPESARLAEPPVMPDKSPTPPPAFQPPPQPAAKQLAKNFIIEIDDYTAEPDSITVDKGTQVTLVVRAKNTNVYYGGIELRSPMINTGTIPAGSSATVTFTADESFEFIPYWPASGVKKDYTFKVNVKKPL